MDDFLRYAVIHYYHYYPQGADNDILIRYKDKEDALHFLEKANFRGETCESYVLDLLTLEKIEEE